MVKFWEKLFGTKKKTDKVPAKEQPKKEVTNHQVSVLKPRPTPQTEEDKLDLLQKQLTETTRVLREDIHKLAERGEKLEELEEETQKLEEESKSFSHQSRELKSKYQIQDHAFIIVCFAMLLGALHGVWSAYTLPIILLETMILGSAAFAINWVVLQVRQKMHAISSLSLEIEEGSSKNNGNKESSNISPAELVSLSHDSSLLPAFRSPPPTTPSLAKHIKEVENHQGARRQMKV